MKTKYFPAIIASCISISLLHCMDSHYDTLQKPKQEYVTFKTIDKDIPVQVPDWQLSHMLCLPQLLAVQQPRPMHLPVYSNTLQTIVTSLQCKNKDEWYNTCFNKLTNKEKEELIDAVQILGVQKLFYWASHTVLPSELHNEIDRTVKNINDGQIDTVIQYIKQCTNKKQFPSKDSYIAVSPHMKFAITTPLTTTKPVPSEKNYEYKTIQLISLDSKKTLAQCKFKEPVRSVIFSPDEKYIAILLWNDSLHHLNIGTNSFIKMVDLYDAQIKCITYSDNEDYIFVGTKECIFQLNSHTGTLIKRIPINNEPIYSLVYDFLENHLFSLHYKNNICQWNVITGELIHTFHYSIKKNKDNNVDYLFCMAYNPHNHYLVAGSYDHNIIAWNTCTKEKINTFEKHAHKVSNIIFSPSKKYVASTSCNGIIKLWNTKTGCLEKSFNNYRNHLIQSIQFNQHETYLILTALNKNTATFSSPCKLFQLPIFTITLASEAKDLLYRLYTATIAREKTGKIIPIIINENSPEFETYDQLSPDIKELIATFFPFQTSLQAKQLKKSVK